MGSSRVPLYRPSSLEEPHELSAIHASIQECIKHNPTDAIPVVCDYAVLVEGDEAQGATLRNSVLNSLMNQFKPTIISSLNQRPEALRSFTKAIVNVSSFSVHWGTHKDS